MPVGGLYLPAVGGMDQQFEHDWNTVMHLVFDKSYTDETPPILRTQTTFTPESLTFVSLHATGTGRLIRITVEAHNTYPGDSYATLELMGPAGWFEAWRLDYDNMKTRSALAWSGPDGTFVEPGLDFWEEDRLLLSQLAVQLISAQSVRGRF